MSADKYPSIFLRQMEAIVYLYHMREIASIKLPSGCSNQAKSAKSSKFVDDF